MDDMFKYKSMNNMAFELDIAGEFIYRGIREFNSLKFISNNSQVFMILYHLAVGVERLQKIICVLWTMEQYQDNTTFEQSLISHSHTGLQQRIVKAVKGTDCEKYAKFDSKTNDFLTLLTQFYNSCRYMRYNTVASENEYEKLCHFIKQHNTNLQYSLNDDIVVTNTIKKFLGRIIGTIVKGYYALIKNGSTHNGVFAYELNSDSNALKVFLDYSDKPNCSSMLEDEKTALREFLVYFRRNSDKDSFFRFLDSIEPLSFDPAVANYYIEAVCEGAIPQEMVDETQFLYESVTDVSSRIAEVSCIGNSMCDFAYGNMNQCLDLIRRILNKPENISSELAELVVYTDDEVFENRILDIKDEFDDLIAQGMKTEAIISKLSDLIDEYKYTDNKDFD